MKEFKSASDSVRDWSLVASAVMRGSYRNATESERESLCIGLRGVGTEQCLKAAARMDANERFVTRKREAVA